jgi:hypothetical protein
MRLRLFSPAAFALVALAACGSDSSGPKVGPAAQIALVSSPAGKGPVTTSVGSFSVKVTDASGHAVAGSIVSFSVSGGGGVVLAPSSVATDASGVAATAVTLGTRTGAVIVTATVSGLPKRIDALVTSTPGPLATVISSPDAMKLWEVGDTARITSLLQDEYRNALTDFVPLFTVADPTLVSVDSSGLVRALRQGGSTIIRVGGSGRFDSVAVKVATAGESPCTDAATPTTLAVGDVTTANGNYICLTGATSASADYAVVAYNSSTDGATAIYSTVQANGVTTPPTTSRSPTNPLRASRSVIAGGTTPTPAQPALDESFHLKLLERARGQGSRYRASRAEFDARLSRSSASGGGLTPRVSRTNIPGGASVGDLVSLNVSEETCTDAIMHGFRVAAVGAKSIVLADTLNPANGFSDQDYARFAARFDTLVYPLDVGAFGAPSDIDQNGKVAILFTEYVNELTPAKASYFIGGFFHPRDILLKTRATATYPPCPTSNEGEMFYMLVPDPSGQVNGNVHSLAFVDTLTTSVLAHEFQHLINATRRVYVNDNFVDFEESWLNEGLSHIAEELLYFREATMQPRQNLTDAGIRADPSKYALWKANAGSNFSRFLEYIQDPGSASPLDPDDALATRGATWALLRFAVDRFFPSDASVWARFTNTESLGLNTMKEALLTDPLPVLADFAVANYVDDLGISTDPRYQHASWNFRDIYSKTFGSRATGVFVPLGYYPIMLNGIGNNALTGSSVHGGSASYYRLTVPAGKEALLTFGSSSGTVNPLMKYMVVRTQ